MQSNVEKDFLNLKIMNLVEKKLYIFKDLFLSFASVEIFLFSLLIHESSQTQGVPLQNLLTVSCNVCFIDTDVAQSLLHP
jgi:hypothetical protein